MPVPLINLSDDEELLDPLGPSEEERRRRALLEGTGGAGSAAADAEALAAIPDVVPDLAEGVRAPAPEGRPAWSRYELAEGENPMGYSPEEWAARRDGVQPTQAPSPASVEQDARRAALRGLQAPQGPASALTAPRPGVPSDPDAAPLHAQQRPVTAGSATAAPSSVAMVPATPTQGGPALPPLGDRDLDAARARDRRRRGIGGALAGLGSLVGMAVGNPRSGGAAGAPLMIAGSAVASSAGQTRELLGDRARAAQDEERNARTRMLLERNQLAQRREERMAQEGAARSERDLAEESRRARREEAELERLRAQTQLYQSRRNVVEGDARQRAMMADPESGISQQARDLIRTVSSTDVVGEMYPELRDVVSSESFDGMSAQQLDPYIQSLPRHRRMALRRRGSGSSGGGGGGTRAALIAEAEAAGISPNVARATRTRDLARMVDRRTQGGADDGSDIPPIPGLRVTNPEAARAMRGPVRDELIADMNDYRQNSRDLQRFGELIQQASVLERTQGLTGQSLVMQDLQELHHKLTFGNRDILGPGAITDSEREVLAQLVPSMDVLRAGTAPTRINRLLRERKLRFQEHADPYGFAIDEEYVVGRPRSGAQAPQARSSTVRVRRISDGSVREMPRSAIANGVPEGFEEVR